MCIYLEVYNMLPYINCVLWLHDAFSDVFYLPLSLCIQVRPDLESHSLLIHVLKGTSLRCITFEGLLGDLLLPILRGLAANTNTIDRTVICRSTSTLIKEISSE